MYQVPAEISLRTATAVLKAGLGALEQNQTDFDLSGVTLADSAAVATLLDWQRTAGKQSKTLQLHAVPANLLSLMRLYGVDKLFTIVAERH